MYGLRSPCVNWIQLSEVSVLWWAPMCTVQVLNDPFGVGNFLTRWLTDHICKKHTCPLSYVNSLLSFLCKMKTVSPEKHVHLSVPNIRDKTAHCICMKFSVESFCKMVCDKCKFYENLLIDSRISPNNINEFVSVLSAFFDQFGRRWKSMISK
jgi:hypothetical protein